MTRSIVEWHPDRLLCKRFDAPNPYPEAQIQTEEAKKKALLEKQALNEKTMETLKHERMRMLAANELQTSKIEDDLESIASNEPQIIQEKPSMDIFKAIFAESDSDEVPDDLSGGVPVLLFLKFMIGKTTCRKITRRCSRAHFV